MHADKVCAVEVCDRPAAKRGWCGAHYARWRNHGDPGTAPVQHANAGKSCSVFDCARPARARSLCGMHDARLRRTGKLGESQTQRTAPYAGQQCSVDGCDRQPRTRGLCHPHDRRHARWGDPLGARPTTSAADRFRRYVQVSSPPEHRPGLGPCHIWTAALMGTGYGAFHPSKGETVLAHRWAYVQERGEIPTGLVLDHLCRNRACVNPHHLEAVTNEENLRRGAGYALRNGMRNTCINGHRYNDQTTYVDPSGQIRCRACARNRDTLRSNRKAVA